MPRMRDSEFALFIIGLVPLIIMFSVVLYIAIARVELGYWPIYGISPDPATFGYAPIKAIGMIGFMLTPIIFVAWVAALVYGYVRYGKEFKINLGLCCFLSGITLFFVFKYCFTPYFAWYFD